MVLDGFWYLTVKERFGNNQVLACEIRTFESACKYEKLKITKQLNVEGNDVAALMKTMQFTPWLRQHYEVEAKNNNVAALTATLYPTLDALEKEGEGR